MIRIMSASCAQNVTVEIIIATYNGMRYLEAQVASLLQQNTEAVIQILIGDDGSTDGTQNLIKALGERYPQKIKLLPNGPGRGASANFSRLLQATTADYVFLCDQDDQWLPDKVQNSLEVLLEVERHKTSRTPALVFSDLEVVDRELVPLAPSLWKYQGLNPEAVDLMSLVQQNVVTGCTVLVNRALLEHALPIPTVACMHDHWLALVAAAIGEIALLRQTTVRYRQHGENGIGACPWSLAYVLRRACKLLSHQSATQQLIATTAQAREMHKQFACALAENTGTQLREYAALAKKSGFLRLQTAWRYGWHRQHWAQTLGWYWLLVWAKCAENDE